MTTQPSRLKTTHASKADAYTCKPGSNVECIFRAMLPVGKAWTYDEIKRRTGMTSEQVGGSLHHPMKIGVVAKGEHRGKTTWRLLKDPLPKEPTPMAPEPTPSTSGIIADAESTSAHLIGPPVRLDLHPLTDPGLPVVNIITPDRGVPDKGVVPTLNLRLKAMTERADAISKEMDKLQAELTAIEEQEQAIRRARDLLVQAGVE